MKPMVVFFAVIAAACGSLTPHGHYAPLAHSAVIAAPIVHAQTNYVGGHAVTHEARLDVRSPAIQSTSILAAPVAHSTYAVAPLAYSTYAAAPLAHSGYAVAPQIGAYAGYGGSLYGHGAGHFLKKRSLYSAPLAYHAPAAVSHQARVDVISHPAVVSHAVHAAPVAVHAAPVVAHVAPAAVSHQSRVDYRSSPAIYSTSYAYAPVAHAAPLYQSAPLHYASPLSHAW